MIDLTRCFTRRENDQEDPHSEQQEIKRAEIRDGCNLLKAGWSAIAGFLLSSIGLFLNSLRLFPIVEESFVGNTVTADRHNFTFLYCELQFGNCVPPENKAATFDEKHVDLLTELCPLRAFRSYLAKVGVGVFYD